MIIEHSDYHPQSPYYAENIAHEETVNKMLRDGYATKCTFNNTFNVTNATPKQFVAQAAPAIIRSIDAQTQQAGRL